RAPAWAGGAWPCDAGAGSSPCTRGRSSCGSTPTGAGAGICNTSRSPSPDGLRPARPVRQSARHRAPSSPEAAGTTPPATVPRTHRTGAAAARAPRPGTAPPRASAPALQFFCDQILHRRVVERHLCVHPLEPGVLGFQLLDPLQVRRLHAAVLRLPLVVRRRADAGLPADVLDRHTGVGLLEHGDDLGLGESGLLHGTSWLGNVPESSTSVVSTYWGSLRTRWRCVSVSQLRLPVRQHACMRIIMLPWLCPTS